MLAEPNCNKRRCRHFIEEGGIMSDSPGDEITERPFCPAFPKGIPREISYGSNKHLKVRPDQKGILVYERIKV